MLPLPGILYVVDEASLHRLSIQKLHPLSSGPEEKISVQFFYPWIRIPAYTGLIFFEGNQQDCKACSWNFLLDELELFLPDENQNEKNFRHGLNKLLLFEQTLRKLREDLSYLSYWTIFSRLKVIRMCFCSRYYTVRYFYSVEKHKTYGLLQSQVYWLEVKITGLGPEV